jgi:secreted PhoX family phosphatase
MTKKSVWVWSVAAALLGAVTVQVAAHDDAGPDFGLFIQQTLQEHSLQLFGILRPLSRSALGPYSGADSTAAVEVAKGLTVSLISSAVAPTADMIALWPNDAHPTHLFVCDEAGGNPSVQRVDLSKPANANATTILTGLSACDPVRRTAWGTIVAAEEAGSTGGLYEIFSPADIMAPIAVTNRATGATTDARVVKRKAVGSLSWEGNPILANGTMYMGDELRPGSGNPGGGIYKFVPDFPYAGIGPITVPAQSPLASGRLYGLRVGSAGDNGQGTEIGQGTWVEINPLTFADANGNVILRNAQVALKFTGYYRPEDMDFDPIAMERGEARACWTNTGRMSNGGGSAVETGSILGEVMCLVDAASASASSGAVPTVRRFIAGDTQANYFDNIAFQPKTGNVVVLEDGEVEVVKKDGTTELRGNDIWMCLPDGADRDVQSDGCIRILSLRDTSSEPTGFIFTASGKEAYVNLQHRDAGAGALLKISGFRIQDHDDHDHDHDGDWDDDSK